MKKIYWLTVLTVLLGLLPCNRLEAADTYLPLIYNNYCSNQHLSLNFLAFGDSITGCYYDDYYGWIDGTPEFPGCGYERRVYDWLNQQFGFCTNKLAYYNYGVGGETTTSGLFRFYDTVAFPTLSLSRLYPATATSTEADVVIIMEGTNDMNVGTTYSTVANNLRTMVDIALVFGKKVILATIPPAFGPNEALRQQRIVEFNPTIRQIGEEKGIPVADVYASLAGHPEYMSADGLHPNAAGFEVMATVFYWTILSIPNLLN